MESSYLLLPAEMVSFKELSWSVTALFATVIFLFYIYMKRQFTYWKKRGIPGPEPELLFGNWKDTFTLKSTEPEVLGRICEDFKNEKYIGCYSLWRPVVVFKDYELIKKVLETDSGHFIDHPALTGKNIKDSPLNSLFTMNGLEWKTRRTYFNKLFTPAKMKEAVVEMKDSMDVLVKDIDQKMQTGNDLDLFDILEKFVIFAISSSLYTLDLKKHDYLSHIIKMASFFLHCSASTAIKFLAYATHPVLFSNLNIATLPKWFYDEGSKLADDLFYIRNKNNVGRNDLPASVQKLLSEGATDIPKISYEEAIGHLFSFMQAGVHTSSITLGYVIYHLAENHDVLQKLRDEVESIMGDEEVPTYELLNKMVYADDIIKETLRLHPLLGILKRVCTKEYKVDEKLTITKGMPIYLDVATCHMNPTLFPDPEVFRPERWSNGEAEPGAFVAFGRGPRICIGKRLAELQMKAAITKLVRVYNFEPSKQMSLPMKMDPQILFLTVVPIGGLYVKFTRRSL